MSESIVLGIVLENHLTGYDIKKVTENRIGVFYKGKFRRLVPCIKKTDRKGTFNNM